MKIRAEACAAFLLAAAVPAGAGVRTTVTLQGQDPAAPKLGLPSVAVSVTGPDAVLVDSLRSFLAGDALHRTHSRLPGEGERPDYTIDVVLEPATAAGIGFRVSLTTWDDRVAWRSVGTALPDGPHLDHETTVSIGRNILSALIHDGWLQARYDPDDPPPAAPRIDRKAR